MQDFLYIIVHIKGTDNVIADHLSRAFATMFTEDIQRLTFREPRITSQQLAQALQKHRIDIISQHHNAIEGHHMLDNTVRKIRAAGHNWPHLKKMVSDFVKACPTCQKLRHSPGQGTFDSTPRNTLRPFQTVEIDFIGPLPIDEDGNQYIMNANCTMSRLNELYAVPEANAICAAECLLDFSCTYDIPEIIRSDQGSHFKNKLLEDFTRFLSIKQHFGIPYNPQIQGITERSNQEAMRHLRAIVFDKEVWNRWSKHLPISKRIINRTYHSAIGTTPHSLIFGNAFTSTSSISTNMPPIQNANADSYIKELRKQIKAITSASLKHQQDVNDKKRQSPPHSFRVHDLVLINYPNAAPPTKIHSFWRGPYEITKVIHNTISCKNLITNSVNDYHPRQLKKYQHSNSLSPIEVAQHDRFESVVEKIIAHDVQFDNKSKRVKRKTARFKVRWENLPADQDSWCKWSEVSHLAAMDPYIAAHPALRSLNS